MLYIVILLYVILFKVLCFHRTQDCQKAQSTCQATRLHWDAHQIMNAVKLLGFHIQELPLRMGYLMVLGDITISFAPCPSILNPYSD